MRETLLVLLDEGDATAGRWLVVGANGAVVGPVEQGALAAAAAGAAGRRVVAVVPGEAVLLTRASLPTQKRQRVLKAVPYALEEQLADDVEQLHFAVGEGDGAGRYPVAVVARARMDAWVEALEGAGLLADRMVPDLLLLPAPADDWAVAATSQRVLVRTGEAAGFAAEPSLAEGMIALAAAAPEARPAGVTLYACDGAEPPPMPEDVQAQAAPCPRGLDGLLAAGLAERDGLDLLQGDYSRRERVGQLWRPWRASAVLVLAGAVIWGLLQVVSYQSLQTERAALAREIEQVFVATFPEARVVNPPVQMEQRLQALRRAAGGTGDSGFLDMLARVGPVLAAARGVELAGASYREGRLDLEVSAGNLQVLDRLKQRLADAAALSVEIQSASTGRDQRVHGRLRLKEAGA